MEDRDKKATEFAVFEMYQEDEDVKFRKIYDFGDNEKEAEDYIKKLNRLCAQKVYFVGGKTGKYYEILTL